MRMHLLAVCATALVPLALATNGGSAATSSPVHSAAWCGNSISVPSARREVGERVRVKARVVRSNLLNGACRERFWRANFDRAGTDLLAYETL